MSSILEILMHTGFGAVCVYLAKECRQSSINQDEEEEKAKEEFRKIREYDPEELANQIISDRELHA